MLQSNGPRSEKASPFSDSEGGVNEIIAFATGLLRRQYRVIVAAFVVALALAVGYLGVTPPTFTAQTQVLLKNPKAAFVKQESPLAESAFDVPEIETHLQLVKSTAVAIAVIRQLKLADDPDFEGPTGLGDMIGRLSSRSAPTDEAERDRINEDPPEGLIDAFLFRLQARRLGMSNIIEIAYSSRSPERAAEVVNAAAAAYIKEQMNTKFEASRSATAWLQDRLRDLGDQARREEQAVDAYRMRNNIVSSGGKPIDEQQLADFNARIVAARAQASDALARLNRYEALLRADTPANPSAELIGATVSDALASPVINTLRVELLELQRRDSEWTNRYGENHQAVKDLRARMRELRNSIRDEARRLAETSRNDYEIAVKRQQEMEKLYKAALASSRSATSAEVALRELESRAKSYRAVYETFQQRYMGAVQQETFPITEARVIYPALPPDSKSKPKSKIVLALGALGGLALGLGLGLLRDLRDSVFRTPGQIEAALHLPCFSVVPLMDAPRPGGDARVEANPPERALANVQTIDSTVVGMPLSRFAETIRSAKIGIDLNPTKTPNRVIGVTSALPNEGKTTIAASLARLIAHGGRSVVLVDCDLRHPSLSAQLTPEARCGLIEVIYGQRFEDALWRDPRTPFAVLPMVRRRPLFHSTELLASEATAKLFQRLRDSFDYVIVDLPPLAPVVDARATASFIDCHLLVVEWGRTKIEVVRRALHEAPNIYDNMVGAVLNKTDVKRMSHYDRVCADYYDERYFARYTTADDRGS
ncbi:exopolysaccharide transport protein family [Rhodoblastus acidophilus]|uniref:Exopolysaccharide transport protein family n=1 Tax=Rhodoblastus acidophilus TaxID=1074 RepID=A0A212QN65_RHOAC|nr:Wzz/FepE/Etk N-terminal domain-containing protein [Rhodoblastus acidophilus]PPQ38920.1 protein tyrosine kinase [Rhodoblastus acidophilus]RAI20839.1 protein tyrosine kinase [Rhodoblastus acidophilus]SNB60795.1 exopolysaccharide transport protein family [Rhodoblastus acidophilus]